MMKYESFISLRYLKSKRRQSFISVITLISVAGVTLGVMALIIVLSVMRGFENDLKGKILGMNADIVVLRSGGVVINPEGIIKKIKEIPGVTGASPFVFSQAMISSLMSATGVVLRGIDPKTIGEVTILPKIIKKGKLDLSPEKGIPGILIGNELAKSLALRVGDVLRVISPQGMVITPVGGIPRFRRFRVKGIFESGMYDYDSGFAFIDLKVAQRFFRMRGGVTGIEVKVKDVYAVKKIGKMIKRKLMFPYFTRDWMTMNRNLFSALKLERITMFIILTLIVWVAAFNIVSSLIMVVMEKNRDIAILKAMGATNRSIMRIFMQEGMIVGIFGTFLGSVFAYIACALLKKYQFIKLPTDVYYISTLPVQMSWFDFAVISVSAIGICFLATIYPARQAANLPPVEGLRYE
jgi:lipoprotein-releasing system permease protein